MTAATARAPLDLRTAEGMLSFVPDCEDRETWLAMGMALKSEFGEAAFDAWDRWSQGGGNYNAKACRASWRGFKARSGGVGIGTLIKFAKDGGYRFDNDDRPAHLTPEHVLLILRLARQAGHHGAVGWLLAELGYAPPVPVEPADVLGELQREFIAATRQMANMAARIERMQAGAAHATVGGVAASVPLHAINAPYGTPVRGVA